MIIYFYYKGADRTALRFRLPDNSALKHHSEFLKALPDPEHFVRNFPSWVPASDWCFQYIYSLETETQIGWLSLWTQLREICCYANVWKLLKFLCVCVLNGSDSFMVGKCDSLARCVFYCSYGLQSDVYVLCSTGQNNLQGMETCREHLLDLHVSMTKVKSSSVVQSCLESRGLWAEHTSAQLHCSP